MSTSSIIRSIRNIMRKDEGVDGDAQSISPLREGYRKNMQRSANVSNFAALISVK